MGRLEEAYRGAASKISSRRFQLEAMRLGPRIRLGSGVTCHGQPLIDIKSSDARLRVGEGVVFTSRSRATALGVNHQTIIRLLGRHTVVNIGANCGLSGAVICAMREISIGDGCLLGANSIIMDTDFHPLDSANRRFSTTDIHVSPVHIGRNVFIGANAIILPGTVLLDHCVVGAGAVVKGEFDKASVVAGNPAQTVRRLTPLADQIDLR